MAWGALQGVSNSIEGSGIEPTPLVATGYADPSSGKSGEALPSPYLGAFQGAVRNHFSQQDNDCYSEEQNCNSDHDADHQDRTGYQDGDIFCQLRHAEKVSNSEGNCHALHTPAIQPLKLVTRLLSQGLWIRLFSLAGSLSLRQAQRHLVLPGTKYFTRRYQETAAVQLPILFLKAQ